MKPPSKAKTRFVPRAVYRKAFAGVVPLCVAACGSSTTSSGDGGTFQNGAVGCAAFGCLGVAAPAFDAGSEAGDAADAAQPDSGDDAPVLGVACLGFCGGGVADAGFGARDAGGDGEGNG
jgi:hypothetical protein